MGSHWKERKPCQKCGGVKRPGQGQRYCQDCYEAAKWAVARKRTARAVRDRDPCQICGRKKEPGHGRRYCERCIKARRQPPRCRDCRVEIAHPKKLCEICKAVAVAKKRAYDVERHRAYRQTAPKRPRRRKSTRTIREDQRMRHRLRAERAGRTVGPARVTPRSNGRVEVRIAPLLPYIRQHLVDTTAVELGEVAHIRPNDLALMLEGQIESIRLAAADRLCLALGLTLNLVYGEQAA